MDLKVNLLETRSTIQMEITNRKTEITKLNDRTEIEHPIMVMKAEKKLADALTGKTSVSFSSLMTAFVFNNAIQKGAPENPEIAVLNSELEVLEDMLKQFPSVKQIKEIGKETTEA